MSFQLPQLPYAMGALAPVLSEETLKFHYGKHHQTYIDNLNKLIQGTMFEKMSLEEIILASDGMDQAVFNNAAQVWNHTFYWMCLTPRATLPSGGLLSAIEATWGSFDNFRNEFVKQAAGNFGSGWTWLVMTTDKTLAIRNTGNAATALASDEVPLLTVDVWEHAYYIDYRNARVDYVKTILDKLVDWEFVAKNYYNAK